MQDPDPATHAQVQHDQHGRGRDAGCRERVKLQKDAIQEEPGAANGI